MASSSAPAYRDAGLEAAVVDLVRVGVAGHGAGVRQLASRLVRSVPVDVSDADAFRRALHEAMASAPSTGLRFAGGAVPTDTEGQHELVDVDPTPNGLGLVVAPDVAAELDELVAERRRADELSRHGVALSRTVLLSGPPGVGKTMTARWLASSMGLPLVTLDLSSVVSSYLGTSGRNIRAVLDYAKSGSCVLLLDEFDAIAKRRDDDSDIGELKRIVNVILVELDRWPDTSLLVAATNHPQLLDPAVGRRFDRLIELELPGQAERRRILGFWAAPHDGVPAIVLDLVAELSEGASGSDLARLWATSLRKAVLHGSDTGDELLQQVAWRSHRSGPARDMLWLMMKEKLGLSARQIATKTGVTHPTVGAAIKRAESRGERDIG